MDKAGIIEKLKKELLPMPGMGQYSCDSLNNTFWFLQDAFPGQQFPLGCVHEFLASNEEELAATKAFIHVLLSHLLTQQRKAVWIHSQTDQYPGALPRFNECAGQLLFIKHPHQKELWWVVEECLKYKAFTALVAELEMLDFTASRRFQLAVERSSLTAFIIRTAAHKNNNNTVTARWKLKSMASLNMEGLPGVGFPSWRLDLLKMRHGKTTSVELVYCYGKLMLRSQFNRVQLHPPQKLAV